MLREIGEMGTAEIAAMTRWATEGCHGDAPRSDQQKRILLGQKLNAAQSATAAAKGAGQDIDHQVGELNHRLAAIAGQIEVSVLDAAEKSIIGGLPPVWGSFAHQALIPIDIAVFEKTASSELIFPSFSSVLKNLNHIATDTIIHQHQLILMRAQRLTSPQPARHRG